MYGLSLCLSLFPSRLLYSSFFLFTRLKMVSSLDGKQRDIVVGLCVKAMERRRRYHSSSSATTFPLFIYLFFFISRFYRYLFLCSFNQQKSSAKGETNYKKRKKRESIFPVLWIVLFFFQKEGNGISNLIVSRVCSCRICISEIGFPIAIRLIFWNEFLSYTCNSKLTFV